jgi:hypothetical protein
MWRAVANNRLRPKHPLMAQKKQSFGRNHSYF